MKKIVINFLAEVIFLAIKLAILLAIAGVTFVTWAEDYDVLGSLVYGFNYWNPGILPKILETMFLGFFLVTFYFIFFLEYKGTKKDPGIIDVWKQILKKRA